MLSHLCVCLGSVGPLGGEEVLEHFALLYSLSNFASLWYVSF